MRRLMMLGGLALATATFVRADEKTDVKAAGTGRGLFLRYCVSCHGTDAKGGGPAAEALKVKVPDLTALPSKDGRFDETRVATSIDGTRASSAHGSREMPVWGKVFESRAVKSDPGWAQTDVWLLTEYVKSIQTAK
jgi:mono/diheme cytochrome c family protein